MGWDEWIQLIYDASGESFVSFSGHFWARCFKVVKHHFQISWKTWMAMELSRVFRQTLGSNRPSVWGWKIWWDFPSEESKLWNILHGNMSTFRDVLKQSGIMIIYIWYIYMIYYDNIYMIYNVHQHPTSQIHWWPFTTVKDDFQRWFSLRISARRSLWISAPRTMAFLMRTLDAKWSKRLGEIEWDG